MAGKRKGISKKTRFSVFARDGFTCVYCGRQPPTVVLNIEHVIPVCKGGTDDEANLRTSCFDCNAGKGAKEIGDTVPTETDRFRQAQELGEQKRNAELLIQTIEAAKEYRAAIAEMWCDALGAKKCLRANVTTIINLVDEFGIQLVNEWASIAAAKTHLQESKAIRYLCGIARNVRKGQA